MSRLLPISELVLTRRSDLFNYGRDRFSAEEFAEAGMNTEDVSLIQFMANQVSHHLCLSFAG